MYRKEINVDLFNADGFPKTTLVYTERRAFALSELKSFPRVLAHKALTVKMN